MGYVIAGAVVLAAAGAGYLYYKASQSAAHSHKLEQEHAGVDAGVQVP